MNDDRQVWCGLCECLYWESQSEDHDHRRREDDIKEGRVKA